MSDPHEIRWPESEMENAIRQYLAEHPGAMDTTEGIAEWWLMRQRVRIDLDALARTLRRLTDEGVVEQVGFGNDARFRLRIRR